MPNNISTSPFRWIAKRKADLIARIDSGEISEAEALRLYYLSPEELAEWRRLYADDGVCGLADKRIPQRRHPVDGRRCRDFTPAPLRLSEFATLISTLSPSPGRGPAPGAEPLPISHAEAAAKALAANP